MRRPIVPSRQEGPKPVRVLSGYFLGIAGAAFFSVKAILIKLAYQPGGGLDANELEALTLLALRMGIALPIYLAIGFWMYHRRARSALPLPTLSAYAKAGATGILGYYIASYTDFQALKYITAQLERLLLFTYPAFVFILAALFFGGRVTRGGVLAIMIAYSGIALIFTGGEITVGDNLWLGSGLVLTCAFAFAWFQLLAKPQIDRMGSGLFTCAAMTAASLAAVCHFLASHGVSGTIPSALDLPARIYILAAMIAVLSTLIPSFLVNMALARIGAEAVSLLGMLGPVVTIMLALVILGEPFGPVDAIGTLLTVFGIGLYSRQDRRRGRPHPATGQSGAQLPDKQLP